MLKIGDKTIDQIMQEMESNPVYKKSKENRYKIYGSKKYFEELDKAVMKLYAKENNKSEQDS